MSQYIGKTISLISNKGLRYVGLLEEINADDATVALKSVRLFGSEGRMAELGHPELEVPPGHEVYDFVVFRGSDVKDLNVLDTPIDQVQPQFHAPPQFNVQTPSTYYNGPNQSTQPTPTSTQQPSHINQPQSHSQTQHWSNPQDQNGVPETTTQRSYQQPPSAAPASAPTQSKPVQTEAPKVSPLSQPNVEARPDPTPTKNEPPTQSTDQPSNSQPRSEPRPAHTQRKASKIEIPTEEFDFEGANAKFSRDLEKEKELEQTGYNKKSSFFDNISSSNEDRSNMRWSEEKNLNMDTFGESSLHKRGGYKGRGRGRGGYRGNYRGRGRGGNRGRSNDFNTKPEWA